MRSPGKGGAGTDKEVHRDDGTMFGYESPPETQTLHRDVFRWVQSLDLQHSLKNVRRDIANGYIVAEIFNRYFPADVQMHSYQNGTSQSSKQDNWAQLQRCCHRQGIVLPEALVAGSMAGAHGAAVALMTHLYQTFTGKRVQQPDTEVPVAVSTASAAALDLLGAGKRAPQAQAAAGGLQPMSGSGGDKALGLGVGGVQTRAMDDAAAIRRKFLGT